MTIERRIEKGELKERPAYEDLLSALALRKNIDEMKEQVRELIKKI